MTKLFNLWNTLQNFWKLMLVQPRLAPITRLETEEEIEDFDLAPYLGWMEEERTIYAQ